MAIISFPWSAVRHLRTLLQVLKLNFQSCLSLFRPFQLVQGQALQFLALYKIRELALKRVFLQQPGLGSFFKCMYVGLEALEPGMKEILLVISIHVIFYCFVHFESYWRVLTSFILLVVLQLTATLVLFSQLQLPLVVERTLLGFQVLLLQVSISKCRFFGLKEHRFVVHIDSHIFAVSLMLE